MNSKYWQKYNLNKKKIIKKITQFNRKNNVNFVEAGHFNHTRDILALSIATSASKNKKGEKYGIFTKINRKVETSS